MTKYIESLNFKKKFPCKLCDYEATVRSSLSEHITNIHQKSENMTCTEYFKSIQKRRLTRQMKNFHSGEQPKYDCQSVKLFISGV